MSSQTISAVVALQPDADRALVQRTLQLDELELLGALDVDEDGASMLEDTPADVVLVACGPEPEGVLAFVEAAVRAHPSRPVVVLVPGSPNGFVRRAFAAGADDIVALDSATAPAELTFSARKAVARRHGAGGSSSGVALGSMICVLGPKGGSGKTLTACNLAVALARKGHRVSMLDLDLQFGDVGLALALEPERTLYDLAKSGGVLDPRSSTHT